MTSQPYWVDGPQQIIRAGNLLFHPDGHITPLPFSLYAQAGDDGETINQAAQKLGPGGLIELGPWYYQAASEISLGISQILRGHGDATRIYQTAPGIGISQHDPNGGGGSFGSYQTRAGGVQDLTLDGSQAGAGSTGYDMGDGSGHTVRGLQIQNYGGAGSIGLHMINRYFWTEKYFVEARLLSNTQGCVIENISGTGIQNSFEFGGQLDLYFSALSGSGGQDGLVIQGGAYLSKCRLGLRGNFNTSPNAMTSAVLRLQGNDARTGFISHINHSEVFIGVETDSGNANAPSTIIFGTTSGANANYLLDSWGAMYFDGGTNGFGLSNATASTFGKFGGPVYGDATLAGLNSTVPTGWP